MKVLECDRKVKELGEAGDLGFSLSLNASNRSRMNAKDDKAGTAHPISSQHSKRH